MIIEFSVKNFGPIKEKQTLSFEATAANTLDDYYIIEPVEGLRLLKLGIIYGPNASGKSTVLKAFEFLRNLVLKPLATKTDTLKFEPFLFDEDFSNGITEFSLSFLVDKMKHSYDVHFTKSHIVFEKLTFHPKGRAAELFTRTTNTEKQLSAITLGSKVKLPGKDFLEGNAIWNNTVLGAFTKTNIESDELKRIIDWFDQVFMPMVTPDTNLFRKTTDRINEKGYKHRVLDLIQKADVQIQDFEIVKEEDEYLHFYRIFGISDDETKGWVKPEKRGISFIHSIIKNDKQELKSLPHKLESKGTLRYFGLSGILASLLNDSHFAAIDEMETSLHPDLMKHFLLVFLANAKSSQLLITTHNLFFLDEKDNIREDSIWFTQKKEDGSTELYSLADFDSSTFRKGASIINNYKAGKLGAKPETGNIFLTDKNNHGKED